MQKLIETIKIVAGQPQFLEYHQRRFNRSRLELFGIQKEIKLENYLKDIPTDRIYKCRIIYATEIEETEYVIYQQKFFKKFKIVKNDDIDYKFKFYDRAIFEKLTRLKEKADDILIIKRGLITDTSIANVAFLFQNQWLTPKFPLLKGTTRERLLTNCKLIEEDISIYDLKSFSKMALINAMIDFYSIADFEILV